MQLASGSKFLVRIARKDVHALVWQRLALSTLSNVFSITALSPKSFSIHKLSICDDSHINALLETDVRPLRETHVNTVANIIGRAH